ncbi:MAG: hypothetical protein PF517_04675 [Salinivirgaceae bacterium]|jgi:hypothetical protein|nr:hypothetical protein [Salinivirgaceae bacterium]
MKNKNAKEVTSFMIDFKYKKNPLLKEQIYHILENECYGEPYMLGTPKNFPIPDCAAEVVVPYVNAEYHIEGYLNHLRKNHGVIADMDDCFPPDYYITKQDEEFFYKLMMEDYKPFVCQRAVVKKDLSLSKGLEQINTVISEIKAGNLVLPLVEAINLAFCFPKYGKEQTVRFCINLFDNLKENIDIKSIEDFHKNLYKFPQFYSSEDLSADYMSNLFKANCESLDSEQNLKN